MAKKKSSDGSDTSAPAPRAPAFSAGADPLAVAPAAFIALPGGLANLKIDPIPYDQDKAQAYLAEYRPRLGAIAADRIEIARLDVDAAGRGLLSVCALIEAPILRAHYEAAAQAGLFLLDNLAHLKALSLIIQLAYRKADAAGAFASGAKIPADLDRTTADLEARMQKVAEHFFGDDPDLGPTLRRLSAGTGYLDRANDLLGYAEIYDAKQSIVSTDPVHYRSADVADAKRLAGEILAHLGAAMSPTARDWYDTLRRTYTLLRPVYTEVRAHGLVFLRYDPRCDDRFPSLFVMGRAGQGRKKPKKDEPT